MSYNDKSKVNKIETGYDTALKKMQKYCAYQDRCHKEVRSKLLQLKIYGEDLENIMSDLIQEDYLNEERYARSYVRGKYRMKKWGRDKILMELKKNQISSYCIKKGFTEIEEEEYLENLDSLYKKFSTQYDKYEGYVKRQKIYAALRRKGYTNEEVAVCIAT